MIQTTHHAKKEPKPITHDSRGTEIKPGLRVAFNKSGNVTTGTIRDFSSQWKISRAYVGAENWYHSVFHMAVIDDSNPPEISHLKNPNSFLILTEDILTKE